MSNLQEQMMARVRKRAPSRERAYKMRRIAMSLCEDHLEITAYCFDCEDAEFLEEMSEFLLDLRVAVRGVPRESMPKRGQ